MGSRGELWEREEDDGDGREGEQMESEGKGW